MASKMLVDASHPEEIRVVVARGNRIEEFDFESASRKPLKGNIYLAKVTRVEPSLQAAFVEYGGNRHGFLAFAEIHPDYYQIPMADRLALIAEQEAAAADDDDDDDDDAIETPQAHDENGNGANGTGEEETGEDVSAVASDVNGDAAVDQSDDAISDDTDNRTGAIPLRVDAQETIVSEPVDEETDDQGQQDDFGPAPEAPPSGELVSVEEDPERQKVDSIGAEDALEEVPRRKQNRQPRRRYKIQEVIKRRQILLVQVVKEERGNKGAALTTYLSLAGRYCVLMPNTARGGGISRKITDANDRRRLKEVARDVEVPQGMGLIVRTAGAQRTRPEIKRDFDYLIRLWESVRDLTLRSTAPCLVYEEGNLIKRSIRDLYTKDVDEVIVEGENAYREAKDFMKMLMPSHAKNVKLYKDSRPLFSRHQVENALDGLLSPTVSLPSGGYIVINQTEALVSIDINSGKATREHSIEETALKTNLEACDEIARQLRLRDLAGLIVIDYIDMEENRNNRAVERRLKEALKHDRARIQVGRISHFGLLEMSRQRLRPGITEGTFRTCPYCEGRGIVRSISSCGLGILRQIEEHLQKRPENLTVRCARDVAGYLLNEKRDSLLNLEQMHGVTVFVVAGGDDLKGASAVIERAVDREIAPRRLGISAPVRIDSGFEPEGEEDGVEDAIEAESAGEEPTAELADRNNGEGEQKGRRRRRRGRRGGRRFDSEQNDRDVSAETSQVSERGDGAPPEPEHSEGNREVSAEAAEEAAESADADAQGKPDGDGENTDMNGRRGRFGRGRGRDRNRGRNRGDWSDHGPREDRMDGEAQSQNERAEGELSANDERPLREDRLPREDRGPREHRNRGGRGDRKPRHDRAERPVELTAPPPQPVIVIPDFIPDPEPRKWQPPAASISPEKVQRKAGWWSKRDR